MELKIDAEFHALIPPLTNEERAELEASLLRDGCRDALVIWDGTIIDGHNRYEICQRHGLPFKTAEMEFASRDEAKVWIIRNQLGRRNLLPFVKSRLVLLAEELVKEIQAKAKARQRGGQGGVLLSTISSKAIKPIHTREELAKIAGVGQGTIDKTRIILREATPEQTARLETGQARINTVYKEIRPQAPQEPEPQEPISYTPKPLLIGVKHIQILAQRFLAEAGGYVRIPDQIALLTEEERKQILKEAEPIENWCKEFRCILSC